MEKMHILSSVLENVHSVASPPKSKTSKCQQIEQNFQGWSVSANRLNKAVCTGKAPPVE